jgi:hypothetical protein
LLTPAGARQDPRRAASIARSGLSASIAALFDDGRAIADISREPKSP